MICVNAGTIIGVVVISLVACIMIIIGLVFIFVSYFILLFVFCFVRDCKMRPINSKQFLTRVQI